MVRAAYILIGFLVAQPVLAFAIEDTHGVLIDRGTQRNNTGQSAVQKKTDAAANDKAKTDKDQQDDAADNSKPAATNAPKRPETFRQTSNRVSRNAQNYYNAKHSGASYRGAPGTDYYHANNTHVQN